MPPPFDRAATGTIATATERPRSRMSGANVEAVFWARAVQASKASSNFACSTGRKLRSWQMR
eukprot:9239714-Alexandrium_andersonii.AAC.1